MRGTPQYRELKGEGSATAQADEEWEYARSYNNSRIQDVFEGQGHSSSCCPCCREHSRKFDTFLDVNLALPGDNDSSCSLEVTFLPTFYITHTYICWYICWTTTTCHNSRRFVHTAQTIQSQQAHLRFICLSTAYLAIPAALCPANIYMTWLAVSPVSCRYA